MSPRAKSSPSTPSSIGAPLQRSPRAYFRQYWDAIRRSAALADGLRTAHAGTHRRSPHRHLSRLRRALLRPKRAATPLCIDYPLNQFELARQTEIESAAASSARSRRFTKRERSAGKVCVIALPIAARCLKPREQQNRQPDDKHRAASLAGCSGVAPLSAYAAVAQENVVNK